MIRHSAISLLLCISVVWLSSRSVRADCDGLFSINDGTLGGGGRVNGDLTNIRGTLAPGNGVGAFSVLGDYCQLPEAKMVFEIGGLRRRVEHDFFSVGGTAELSGEFRIDLVNDFVPSVGDEFVLLSFANANGEFDTVTTPSLGAADWDLSTLLVDGVARVVPEPAVGWVVFLGLVGLIRRTMSNHHSVQN